VPRRLSDVIERELEALERSVAPRPPGWAWIPVVLGLLAVVGLGAHAAVAYATIGSIDNNAKIATANPVLLFQDVATNGPRVPPGIDSSSRAAYTRAIDQYVLDGTGVCLGVALAVAGLFVRLNR
jgi:hypothetical protein